MLLYGHDKKFLGISESYLQALSFLNLADFQSRVSDFADLFVKIPGHIYNFKNIHWIDYLECSQSDEGQRVVIQIKDRGFLASITLESIYLLQEPSKKVYIVNLNNIKSLSADEDLAILENAKKEVNENRVEVKKELPLTDLSPKIVFDPYDVTPDKTTPKIEQNEKEFKLTTDVKEEIKSVDDIYEDLLEDTKKSAEIRSFSNYTYNPSIASNDLGLPPELIEEFVQDFIFQANSLKSNLYDSLKNGDITEIKTGVHKLVGVALNLKIEDVFDTLSKIDLSQDIDTIRPYLDNFYKIIDKLSTTKIYTPKDEESDAPMVLTFKDDSVVQPKESEEFFQQHLLDDVVLYSKKNAANEIGLDIDSFNTIFEEYLIESREVINLITKSAKEHNLKECKEAAIKLKGMSDNMRVCSFDEDLEKIINADDITILYTTSEDIASILDKLSNIKE